MRAPPSSVRRRRTSLPRRAASGAFGSESTLGSSTLVFTVLATATTGSYRMGPSRSTR
ncbi:hypothetical protein [Amycolatopsis sp. NPDC058986]|uniref:hypothetical protein n=1 Tax=unclassified Amycolatopsis TaxID=2618356 RepID=UPI00367164AA